MRIPPAEDDDIVTPDLIDTHLHNLAGDDDEMDLFDDEMDLDSGSQLHTFPPQHGLAVTDSQHSKCASIVRQSPRLWSKLILSRP